MFYMILPDAAKTVKQGANIANVKRKTCATMINEEKKKRTANVPRYCSGRITLIQTRMVSGACQ